MYVFSIDMKGIEKKDNVAALTLSLALNQVLLFSVPLGIQHQ